MGAGHFPLYPNPVSKEFVEKLFIKIEYAKEELKYYHTFLNEARLSALAISIYLASIKTYPVDVDDLKVIYLDDVFIGLDTSNRYPLLELIKNEFIDSGYQVFISTYDREWFELSRHWFDTKAPGKVKSLELFIENDGNQNTPDYPIVIPYEDYLAKAKAYFKCKDYPAAGNYLRKECESIIKKYLPNTYKIDGNGKSIEELEPLIQKMEELFDDSGIVKPIELLDAIRIYRKALLNPTSHNDIKSPLFKKEIDEAFEIANKLSGLPELKREMKFNKGAIFIFSDIGSQYVIQLESADNIFLSNYGAKKALSKPRYKIKTWKRNNVEFATDAIGTVMPEEQRIHTCEQIRTVEEIFNGISRSVGIPVPDNINGVLQIGGAGYLNDLVN